MIAQNILDSSPDDQGASTVPSEVPDANQQSHSDNDSPAEERLRNGDSLPSSSDINRSDSSINNQSSGQATPGAERELITPTPPYLETMRQASKILREAHNLLCPEEQRSEDFATMNGEFLISPNSPVSPSANDFDRDLARAKSLMRQVIWLLEGESRQLVHRPANPESQEHVEPAEPMQRHEAENTEVEEEVRETEPEEDVEAEIGELSDEALAEAVARGKANFAWLQDDIRERKERLRILQAEIAADNEEELGR